MIDGTKALLKDVIRLLEDGRLDQDHTDQMALRIRHHLGLCTSGGCWNQGLTNHDAEGYCGECLEG